MPVNSTVTSELHLLSSIMAAFLTCLSSLAAVTVAANPLQSRQTTTAVVNFGNNTGAPQHLASGTLYGLPDATTQIPSSFFTNIGWNYERAGGAQDPGNTGWIGGLASYEYVEAQSDLSVYSLSH